MSRYFFKNSILFIFMLFSYEALPKCIDSSIVSPSPFMGNNDEIFKLSDGSLWIVKNEYEYLYEYYPSITICPDEGFMIVDGKKLNISSLSGNNKNSPKSMLIETNIAGEFKGFDGNTIFKLTNGQIWQQSEYWYHYYYAYSPKIILYTSNGHTKLKVDGIEKSIFVIRLK